MVVMEVVVVGVVVFVATPSATGAAIDGPQPVRRSRGVWGYFILHYLSESTALSPCTSPVPMQGERSIPGRAHYRRPRAEGKRRLPEASIGDVCRHGLGG